MSWCGFNQEGTSPNASRLTFHEFMERARRFELLTTCWGSPFACITADNIAPRRTTGRIEPSTGSVFSRGLAFHTLAHSNRDQNRDFWNGTVTGTVTKNEGGALSAGRGPAWGPRRWYMHPLPVSPTAARGEPHGQFPAIRYPAASASAGLLNDTRLCGATWL